ncbi:MAG: DUF5106 domain-containing protein [Flavobacteriales bacterium]|nr:DUF5106 domain-containing protein [Flavobacteriales bacterium]
MRIRISLLLAALPLTGLVAQEQRRLEFRITGTEKDTVYLANYYGNKLYYADTAVADAKGEVVFARPQGYKAGVYAVVVKGPKYFELIVNEPQVRMRTAAADLMGAMVVEKSQENTLFFGYIRFLNERKSQGDSLRTLLNDATDPLRRSVLKGRLEELDEEVRAYQSDLVAKAPGSLVAAIVRMSMPVDLEKPRLPDGRVDSIAAYYQYRAHYWDHVDLKDPRIIHTPVFQNKFDEYIGAVVPQIPDTIIKLADDLIGRLGPSEDLFRFVVHGITYKYETSDIMGMDAVFVHMALTYYCPKAGGNSKAFWMSEEKLKKLCERAQKQAPLVIGAKSTELILPDTTEQVWKSLHKLPNDYVLLVFWDPHCGHCKKELPALYTSYRDTLRPMGIEVFSVAKATDKKLFDDWKAFIREHKMDWVNVGLTHTVYEEAKKDPYKYIPKLTTIQSLNYADSYDVYATPKFFLIGPDRKIVGKQLNPTQVADLVKRLRERDKAGAKP